MSQTILVLEDSKVTQHIIMDALQRAGYQTHFTGDGYEAVDWLVRQPPDLVLCDLTVQGIDGYQVISFMRSSPRLADIPVIVISVSGEDWSKRKARLLGADDYLIKPFSEQELISTIRQYLEKDSS